MKYRTHSQIHSGKGGSALHIRVIPRSSHNEIADVLEDGTIKVRLTAPPVEGQANVALVGFLARLFDTSASNFEIISGATSRDKIVIVFGLKPEEIQTKLVSR